MRTESKHEVARRLQARYVRASRKLKSFLLDEFGQVTGDHHT